MKVKRKNPENPANPANGDKKATKTASTHSKRTILEYVLLAFSKNCQEKNYKKTVRNFKKIFFNKSIAFKNAV